MTAPIVPTPAPGFKTKMVRQDGTPAVWPIVHEFYDCMETTGGEHHIVAETPEAARGKLVATGGLAARAWHFQWVHSKDAEGRFVYDPTA